MKVSPCASRLLSVTWSALYVELPRSSQGIWTVVYCGNGFIAWAMVPVKFENGIWIFGNRACAFARLAAFKVEVSRDPNERY